MRVDELDQDVMLDDGGNEYQRIKEVARLAECYVTGTPHDKGYPAFGGRLTHKIFNRLVKETLGIAEPEKTQAVSITYTKEELDRAEDAWERSRQEYAESQVDPAELARLREVVEKLKAGLIDVHELIGQSSGVYGLHLNSDPSPWSELLPPGRFSKWLEKYDDAIKALDGPALSIGEKEKHGKD